MSVEYSNSFGLQKTNERKFMKPVNDAISSLSEVFSLGKTPTFMINSLILKTKYNIPFSMSKKFLNYPDVLNDIANLGKAGGESGAYWNKFGIHEIMNDGNKIINFLENHHDKWPGIYDVLKKLGQPGVNIVFRGLSAISAVLKSNPDNWDKILGDLIKLPKLVNNGYHFELVNFWDLLEKYSHRWNDFIELLEFIDSGPVARDVFEISIFNVKGVESLMNGNGYDLIFDALIKDFGHINKFLIGTIFKYSSAIIPLLSKFPDRSFEILSLIDDFSKNREFMSLDDNGPSTNVLLSYGLDFFGDFLEWYPQIESYDERTKYIEKFLSIFKKSNQPGNFMIYGIGFIEKFIGSGMGLERSIEILEELSDLIKDNGTYHFFKYGLNFVSEMSVSLATMNILSSNRIATGSSLVTNPNANMLNKKQLYLLHDGWEEDVKLLLDIDAQLQKIKENSNLDKDGEKKLSESVSLAFEYGLNYLNNFKKSYPEIWENKKKDFTGYFAKIIFKSRDNPNIMFKELFGLIKFLDGENIEEFMKLLEYLSDRKGDMETVSLFNSFYIIQWSSKKRYFNKEEGVNERGLYNLSCNIFNYCILNKRKFMPSIIHKLHISKNLGLGIDYLTFNRLIEVDLYKSLIDKNDIKEAKTDILGNMERLLKLSGFKNPENKMRDLKKFLSTVGKFDDNNLKLLRKIFADVVLQYFDVLFERKLKSKVTNVFKDLLKNKDDGTIIQERMLSDLFIEGFMMYQNAKYNKNEFKQVLVNYLLGKIDYIDLLPNNKSWIEAHSKKQGKDKGIDMSIWNDSNEKSIDIGMSDSKNIDISGDLGNFLIIANNKISELGLEKQDSPGKLINYFDTELKSNKDNLRAESVLEKSIFDNLFDDLALQVASIKRLNNMGKQKEITKIRIYKETDPMRVLMMGNWVDGSCLSFYNSVGNFWSCAVNALDVNKGVFYIEDQGGNIIGRVLVAIDENNKLLRFPVYKRGNIGIDLNKYFNDYIKLLADKAGLGLNGEIGSVKLLNGERWYQDPVIGIV